MYQELILINQAIGTSKKKINVGVIRFKGTAKCFLQPQNNRITSQYRRQIANILLQPDHFTSQHRQGGSSDFQEVL